MTALCGRKDDAYVGSECPLEENARRNDDNTRVISLPRVEAQFEDIGRRIELEARTRIKTAVFSI